MFVQWLYKVSGGKWKLSLGERPFYYCHPVLTDSYKPCPFTEHVSRTLRTLQILEDMRHLGGGSAAE